MTAINWQLGINGSWNDPSKWLPHSTPTSADDVTIAQAGTYTVNLGLSGFANSLTFNAADATFNEGASAVLTVTGAVNLDAGTMILKGANSFGSFNQSGGVLQLYNANALGSGDLNLTGGELTGMATETIGNLLNMGGSHFTIDAATGTTVNFGGGNWFLDTSMTPVVQFGSSTRTGTVVWNTPYATVSAGLAHSVDIEGGTLKGGDDNFYYLFYYDAKTTVAAGAVLDLAGHSITGGGGLYGFGDIVNTGATASLTLNGGVFAGDISTDIAVEIGTDTTFITPQSYTGGTTIDGGATLFVEGDGGGIGGDVAVDGTLYDVRNSGVMTLGVVSGTGSVVQVGHGTLVLNQANTYSGGTTVNGLVEVGNDAALGTGLVTVDNGELLAIANVTLTNAITLHDNATLAAANGKTLTINSTDLEASSSVDPFTLTVGDSTHKGTVVFNIGGTVGTSATQPFHVNIAYGTVREGGGLGYFTYLATDTTIALGATLDVNGTSLSFLNLTSAGLITSATAATVYLGGASGVSGRITGKLGLEVDNGVTTLTGANTYSGGTTIYSTLQIGDGEATGSIGGTIDDEGALIVKESGAVTLNGLISGPGSFTQSGKGTTTLGGLNTYSGGATIEAGTLVVTHGSALGTGNVTMNGAKLIATGTFGLAATQNGANSFSFTGANTIAAAHGKTLFIGGAQVDVNAGTLIFGDGGNDGTVVFTVAGGADPGPFAIRVNAGTLKAGDAVFGAFTGDATSVTIAASATLDLAGFHATAKQLLGAGMVTSATAAILTDAAGTFSGAITGKIALKVGNVTLTGANTYTGGTTIVSGYILKLGNGGATGSIVGNVLDDGTLFVNESGVVSLAGVISGGGIFTQAGTGTTTLSGLNTYSGGTTVQKGVLVSANGKALGVGGVVTLTGGGEFLASASQAFSHDLHTTGTATIAAADATTLNLSTGADTFDAGKIVFGEGANDGTVVFKASVGVNLTDATHTSVEVKAGTLKSGDTYLSALLSGVQGTKIDAGATIDAAGRSMDIRSLTGSGSLTNTGVATGLTLFGTTNFSGVISGKYTIIDVFGTTTLSGNETFTGTAEINGSTLTLSGLWNEAVRFNGGGTLVLSVPSRFTGTVQGFSSGSTIDLKNVNSAAAILSYDSLSHILTVTDGSHTDHLTFSDILVQGNFAVSTDGSGGTDISWQTPPPGGAAVAKPPVVHQFVSAMATFAPPAAAISHPAIQAQAASMAHLAVARM